MQYQEQKFNLPTLKGISHKQLEAHLKLYGGYVKFTNHLRETLADLRKDTEKNSYAISEVLRRFSFEFNGMRMHEYYFEQLENSSTPLITGDSLAKVLTEKYGSLADFENHFKTIGMMRGVGWTVLAWDPKGKTPHAYWVGDHELGQLAGLPILLALDMWEHAYMVDYAPADKKKYIEAFWDNLNWSVVEERLAKTR